MGAALQMAHLYPLVCTGFIGDTAAGYPNTVGAFTFVNRVSARHIYC